MAQQALTQSQMNTRKPQGLIRITPNSLPPPATRRTAWRCGLDQLLTGCSPDSAIVFLPDLKGNDPAALGGVLQHSPILRRQRLLVVGGNPRVQLSAKHFWLSSWLA